MNRLVNRRIRLFLAALTLAFGGLLVRATWLQGVRAESLSSLGRTQHREEVTAEFSIDEYLALQRDVHRVGEAVRRAVPTERLYVLSLGSKAGNAHVHWHLAPLPPGVPYAEQQLAALDIERRGVLDVSARELEELADRVRAHL